MSVTSIALQFTIVDLLSRGLTGIKSRLTAIAQGSKEVQRSFDRMTQSFKHAAMAGIATKEIARGLRPAITLAAGLQEEMLGIEAELSGAGKSAGKLNDELKEIKATAFSVQAWTPFDMTQIVALEKELIKAGANIESVTGKTGAAAATAALAVYEKLDPVITGKALIGIGTPFKIAADQYMNLADMVSRAASASTVGAGEIAETAKYAAGPMAALGRSSKEMLALSAVMAQIGVVGTMAGTGLKNFFLEAAKHKMFRDAKGNLLPTVKIMEILRTRLKGMGDAQKSQVLKKLFGEQGMPVALALLNEEKGSYEEILKAMDESLSLQDKLNKSMEGFGKQLTSLGGTFQSTIAGLFTPALAPLTAVLEKTNEFVAAIGSLSQKSDTVGKAVSGVSLGAVATGAAATAALAGAGIMYGRRVLKGAGGIKGLLGRAGGTAAGIAEGKAVQAATGVTPVFVTNWPAGGIGVGAADIQGTAKAGSLMKKALPIVGKSLAWLTTGAGALASSAGLAAAAAGTALYSGYDVARGGTGKNWISDLFESASQVLFQDGKTMGERMYDWLNKEGVKNTININIDKDGRVTTNSDNMNTQVNTSNHGYF